MAPFVPEQRAKRDPQKELQMREANDIEILILHDGQGRNNPPRIVKYKALGFSRSDIIQFVVKEQNIAVKEYSHGLRGQLNEINAGKVGILNQYYSLPLSNVVDVLFSKGTKFIVQVKRYLPPQLQRQLLTVLFMNSTCEPPKLEEYLNIPHNRVAEFIKEKNAMSLIHRLLCAPLPSIVETKRKLDNCETEFEAGELDGYKHYLIEAPAKEKQFEEILEDNKDKGLMFLETRKSSNCYFKQKRPSRPFCNSRAHALSISRQFEKMSLN